MAEIDNLEIKISASVATADKAINSLIGNLGKLATALKIDTSGLEKIGKSINLSGIDKLTKNVKRQTKDVLKLFNKTETEIQQMIKEISKKSLYLTPEIDTSNIQREKKKYENQLRNSQNELNRVMVMPSVDGQIKKIASLTAKINEAENALDRITEINGKYQESLADMNTKGLENVKDEMEQIEEVSKRSGEKIKASVSGTRYETRDPSEIQKYIDNYALALESSDKLTSKTKQFGYTAKNAFSLFSSETEISKEKTTLLGNRVEELKEKLKSMKAQGLNFGDAGFDKAYADLNEAEKELKKYKESLISARDEENKAGKETNGLSNALNRLKTNTGVASNSVAGFGKGLSKTFSNMKSVTRSIISSVGIMGGLYGAIRGIGKALDISSDLTEVQNVVDVTFGNMAYKIEEFADASIESFGLSELAAKKYASRFQSMGTAMGFPIDKMSDMSIELTKLTADMASFYNVEQETVAKALQSGVMAGQTRPLRQYGIDLTQATLQEWALKNGLDANIQSMTQAEKTMLRYQYVLSQSSAAQGDFARTSGRLCAA